MTEVAFYHLQKMPLRQVLQRLLEKTLAGGKRAVVMAGSEPRVEALNDALWMEEPDSWLPHGAADDGEPERQPIWLTCHDENVNGSTFLFLCDGVDSRRVGEYERCFDLFDGNDADAVAAARERWTARKAEGHAVTYWQQASDGRWEKKA